jgi:hypothetical protein
VNNSYSGEEEGEGDNEIELEYKDDVVYGDK